MKTHVKWISYSAILILLFCLSCSKDEGVGGTSTIKGKVYAKYYNATFSSQLGESYAPEEDIYIIYGDNYSYNDKQKTNYNGSFEFKYLRMGKYKVYAYSKDTTLTNPSGKFAVIEDITINENGETVTTNDIIIAKN